MLHSFFCEDRAGEGWCRPATPRPPNHRRRARGQAMVEMALVIGILLLVILGGLDGLQIMMTQYTVSQAVRASAHQAALVGGPDGKSGTWGEDIYHPSGTVAETARVVLDSGMMTDSRNATITVACARTPCRRYDPITVRIQYQDEIWAPIGPFTTVSADLSATRLSEKDGQ
jgi:TadE-like protein